MKSSITVSDIKEILRIFNIEDHRLTKLDIGCGVVELDGRDKRILAMIFGDHEIIERILRTDLLLQSDFIQEYAMVRNRILKDLTSDLNMLNTRFC